MLDFLSSDKQKNYIFINIISKLLNILRFALPTRRPFNFIHYITNVIFAFQIPFNILKLSIITCSHRFLENYKYFHTQENCSILPKLQSLFESKLFPNLFLRVIIFPFFCKKKLTTTNNNHLKNYKQYSERNE